MDENVSCQLQMFPLDKNRITEFGDDNPVNLFNTSDMQGQRNSSFVGKNNTGENPFVPEVYSVRVTKPVQLVSITGYHGL